MTESQVSTSAGDSRITFLIRIKASILRESNIIVPMLGKDTCPLTCDESALDGAERVQWLMEVAYRDGWLVNMLGFIKKIKDSTTDFVGCIPVPPIWFVPDNDDSYFSLIRQSDQSGTHSTAFGGIVDVMVFDRKAHDSNSISYNSRAAFAFLLISTPETC